MTYCRISLGLLALALALVLPGQAGASDTLDSYCSPSGDYCTSVTVNGGRVNLRIATFSFRGRYKLCVRGPANKRCHNYGLHSDGDLWVGKVDWAGNFPSGQHGVYHVTWHKFGSRLGPTLSWNEVP